MSGIYDSLNHRKTDNIESLKVIKCFNCGANPSPTVRPNEYRCDYCGTLIISTSKPEVKSSNSPYYGNGISLDLSTISCSGTFYYGL